jgi:hypothetical protein
MHEDNGHVSFVPATLIGAPNFHYDIYPLQRGVGEDMAGWLAGSNIIPTCC